jgi:hypothetical protein
MRIRSAAFALVLAVAVAPLVGGDAHADETAQQKPRATKASVLQRKQKLEQARDAMRALASTAAPKGLTAEQRKTYAAEMLKVQALADGADVVTKKLDKELADTKDAMRDKLDSLSEMGEMESLRLQMAMDRLSKLMSTLSNLLKKASETASAITQNLK